MGREGGLCSSNISFKKSLQILINWYRMCSGIVMWNSSQLFTLQCGVCQGGVLFAVCVNNIVNKLNFLSFQNLVAA